MVRLTVRETARDCLVAIIRGSVAAPDERHIAILCELAEASDPNLARKRGEPVSMRVAYGEAYLDFIQKHGVKVTPELRAKIRGVDLRRADLRRRTPGRQP